MSTRPRCAVPLVFSLGPLTGSPSLLSQFPAIVLGAATGPGSSRESGKRWDVKAAHFLLDQLRLLPTKGGGGHPLEEP